MDHKNILVNLFKGYKSQSYVRMVESRSDIDAFVQPIHVAYGSKKKIETIWCIVNDTERLKCKCGNYRVFETYNKGYRKFCSISCPAKGENHSEYLTNKHASDPEAKQAMITTWGDSNFAKYGVRNIMHHPYFKAKQMSTCQLRLGAPTPFQSKLIQDKIKQINLDKLGVEYPFQSPVVQQKAKDKVKENHPDIIDCMQIARKGFQNLYGCNPFQIPENIEKSKRKRIERYGYQHARYSHLSKETIEILDDPEKFKVVISGLTKEESAKKLGVYKGSIVRKARLYGCEDVIKKPDGSSLEVKFKELIDSLGFIENVDYITGDRKILQGKELDFYFPESKIAFEVGSIYMHSEMSSGRGEEYHYNKWKGCIEQDIVLYQYLDSEIEDSWELIEQNVRNVLLGDSLKSLGDISYSIVDQEESLEFIEEYNLNKFFDEDHISYGSYSDGKLILMISLSQLNDTTFELTKITNNIEYDTNKLLTDLINHSMKDLGIKEASIVSYSDNRHTIGDIFKNSDFDLIEICKARYHYTDKKHHELEDMNSLQKVVSEDVSVEDEWEAMKTEGYDRFWDAGYKAWCLDYKS